MKQTKQLSDTENSLLAQALGQRQKPKTQETVYGEGRNDINPLTGDFYTAQHQTPIGCSEEHEAYNLALANTPEERGLVYKIFKDSDLASQVQGAESFDRVATYLEVKEAIDERKQISRLELKLHLFEEISTPKNDKEIVKILYYENKIPHRTGRRHLF
jgi:hypothetical protein